MSSLIGQSLGRYQIRELLGEGGMAMVYKAYDTLLERFVAIKVIRTDQFAPAMLDEMMKRFEREAKALAKLSHPNIVHVHDYGNYEGAPYLVMEYLPSGSLKQDTDKPMPWQQALHILLPIAQALAYAHEHNIIHRDIKPGNILLTEKGLPMLSDFGIAKILENNQVGTLTATGMGIGTPEYMAPEQWTGQSSPQSDIYSLGVVLYELLTGRKPYTADTPVGVMLKQVKDPPPPPSQFMPDLPKELENILLKALQRQPDDRYKSMNQLAEALETLSGERTLAAGVKVPGVQTGQTQSAPPNTGQEEKLAPALAGSESKPDVGRVKRTPNPPEERHQASSRWGRWIPVGVLGMFLCIGVVAGASFLMKGLNGKAPLAVSTTTPFTPTLTSAPTQLIQQPPPDPQPFLPTLTQGITSIPPSAEINVVWDISHGPRTSEDGSLYTPDGMYKSLTQALSKNKIVISGSDLTNLNSYDILVLSETSVSKAPLSNNEADKIEQFVRVSGHGLLILSEIPGLENLVDGVSRRFLIGLGELTSDGPVSFSNEPFFSGVNSVQFLSEGGILQVSPPAQTAAQDKNGNSVIAYCECDAGRVMVISDGNLWDNGGLSQANNQRFATNVFKWLAKLSP